MRAFTLRVRSFFLTLERFYFMPNRIFDLLFNIAWGARELKALKDKRYRKANKKYKKSKEFNDLMYAFELREKIAPEDKFIIIFRKGRELKFSNLLNKLVEIEDKLGRGFTERDLWNLDESMALRLGTQLLEFEKITHSYPESKEFQSLEDWRKVLRTHGRALLKYGMKEEDNHKLLEIAVKLRNAGEEDEYQEIIDRLHNLEHVMLEDVKAAYLFLGENFSALWD